MGGKKAKKVTLRPEQNLGGNSSDEKSSGRVTRVNKGERGDRESTSSRLCKKKKKKAW